MWKLIKVSESTNYAMEKENLHEQPAFNISKTLAHLGPLERRVRDTRACSTNHLNRMDLLLSRKPLCLHGRVGKEKDEWKKDHECYNGAHDVKPFPRRYAASQCTRVIIFDELVGDHGEQDIGQTARSPP